MTQKDIDLLLRDFCGRLPYGLKVQVLCWDEKEGEINVPLTVYSVNRDGYVYFESNDYNIDYSSIEECKPYLRPMSSMTKEEYNEVSDLLKAEDPSLNLDEVMATIEIDWLNKNMFDFRGLIPKDFALSTDEFNPYKH